VGDFNILALITAALRPYDFARSALPDAPVVPDRLLRRDALRRWLGAARRIGDRIVVRRARPQAVGSPQLPSASRR
jgi:hypothetical protein